jgi:uncharacterized repeat protein (TIGR03847 family)
MSRQIHQHPSPDRFVAGTVGLPGERTFYLQARSASHVTSVALEKAQVLVLAERVDQLLDEVAQTRDPGVPARFAGMPDVEPLDLPLVEEFRVGAMSLGWDDSTHCVVLEAHAIAEEGQDVPEIGSDDDTGPDSLRVMLTAMQARGFAERARSVVSAGRPPCPLCLQPLDPQGHICPRANGYRRRP